MQLILCSFDCPPLMVFSFRSPNGVTDYPWHGLPSCQFSAFDVIRSRLKARLETDRQTDRQTDRHRSSMRYASRYGDGGIITQTATLGKTAELQDSNNATFTSLITSLFRLSAITFAVEWCVWLEKVGSVAVVQILFAPPWPLTIQRSRLTKFYACTLYWRKLSC